MENIEIRKIDLSQVDLLAEMSRQTFLDTFSEANTEENMAHYLAGIFSVNRLAEELNDKDSEFYFAWLGDEAVGYLKLNFGDSQTDIKDNTAVEIERIYVMKTYLGKNVGQSLYEKALEVSKQKDANYVWLGVWEENPRAIRFYEKNGFVAFDKHQFILGDDVQTDIMMKLELR